MKRSYLIATIFLGVLCLITMLKPGTAAINYEKDLMPGPGPGSFHVEYFEYSNFTDADAVKNAQTHLVLFSEPQKISFASERACSLFILNESEMLRYVNGTPFVAKKTWANITTVEEELTYQKLVGEYGIETYEFNKTGDRLTRYAAMYFAVQNEANNTNRFSLRVGYKNEFVIFLDDFFRIVITFVFFFYGVKLLLDARQARKEGHASKTHVYNNYGIAFFLGGIATLLWEIYHWYEALDASVAWIQPLKFEQIPNLPILSQNILSFVTFVSLGFSILFMSNTVEKKIQNKKIPIFTYILLVAELLVVGCVLVPAIFLFVFYPWIVALLLTAANILITYLKVARITSGSLRKQAVTIFSFLLALYLCISLVRILVIPEFVGNALSTVFAIGVYNSLKMAREIRKQEESQVTA
jgi:hypothetical protein